MADGSTRRNHVKPILDATAGNRTMWKCKNPPHVIFLDCEPRLRIPPDVLARWEYLPFRSGAFSLGIFDPPHRYVGKGSIFNSPTGSTPLSTGTWYGSLPSTWKESSMLLIKAQLEFLRVTSRLVLKWSEVKWRLYRAMTCLADWKPVCIKEYTSPKKRSKARTYWVTLEPKR